MKRQLAIALTGLCLALGEWIWFQQPLPQPEHFDNRPLCWTAKDEQFYKANVKESDADILARHPDWKNLKHNPMQRCEQ